jgi:hypothetical protein
LVLRLEIDPSCLCLAANELNEATRRRNILNHGWVEYEAK